MSVTACAAFESDFTIGESADGGAADRGLSQDGTSLDGPGGEDGPATDGTGKQDGSSVDDALDAFSDVATDGSACSGTCVANCTKAITASLSETNPYGVSVTVSYSMVGGGGGGGGAGGGGGSS
ncbi:MAG: hypothetical protein ACLP1X_31505, partial [Polyangiaceae bacterium]